MKPSGRSPCASLGDPDSTRLFAQREKSSRAAGAGLVAAGSQRRDRVEPFFLQVLIELVGRQLDRARVAAVADDEQAGRGHAHEARRIGAVAADDRLAAGRILDDELIDERGIARQRIAEEVLPDAQPHADDLAGFRREGRRLDPHVVGGERRAAQRDGRHHQQPRRRNIDELNGCDIMVVLVCRSG